MSKKIKDLCDYDLVKKCDKCGIISLKSNFHKRSKSSDGFHPQCKFCIKEYYVDNKDRLLNKHKFYNKRNRDQKKYESKNHDRIFARKKGFILIMKKTDNNFRLICRTRSRIHQSSKNISKQSSTKEVLGIDVATYRKWIEWQMTPEMNWSNIQIDHVKAICMFDVSKDEEFKKTFSWKYTQPLLKHEQQ